MAIIGYDPEVPTRFVPKWQGNRESDNPCVVLVKFRSHSKIKPLRQAMLDKRKGHYEDLALQNKVTEAGKDEQFLDAVVAFENYIVNGVELTDPVEVLRTIDESLLNEISLALDDSERLTEGQAKNFERASDSGSHSPEAEVRSDVTHAERETKSSVIAKTAEA